ncbi:MAG: ABC transporter ATP-binding protein [Dehalococcoidales bacterium]
MAIIEVRKLTKEFGDLTAVDGVSLDIEAGECFGLLGPNGAGKTTLVRMITAVTMPTAGDIQVLGRDLKKYSRQIKAMFGVVPQLDNLDPELTVLRNLTIFARYFDIPGDEARRRSMAALKLYKLEGKAKSRIKELSGGMRRRLLLARGLINDPRILILDEPSIGLDPQSKYLVWQKLKELRQQGVTQLLSTQNMDEATALCDRVAIMHQGRVLAVDSPKALISSYVGDRVVEIEVREGERQKIAAELKRRGLDFESADGIIQIFHGEADKLIKELEGFSWNLWSRLATLEDVFLRLTGRVLIE